MVGRVISHYRITGQLGAGGMGVVYSAEDVRLGRPVALKFVSQDLADDEQAVQRLRSEARAASALNHPHICTIYDIGEDHGRPFIVMELMKGQTLRERLMSGALSPHQLLDVGIEIADALHVAHTSGIIHRDIKPGNIFLTESGHVKILDFGLAKLTPLQMGTATTAHSPTATAAGVTLGTTGYMSPEQVAGEQLDGRSDLFSLGVVLYEAATGQHPFPGKTAAAVVAAILDRAPAPVLARNATIPVRLQEAIENCLEKDRELRYQSAADLRADLKRVRRDIESSHFLRSAPFAGEAGISRSSGSRSSRERSSQHELAAREPSSSVSHRPALAIGAVAILAAVGIAVFAAYQLGTSRPQDPPAAPATVSTPDSQAQVSERLRLAQASLDAKNYRGALDHAAEILRVAPGHADATRIRNVAQEMVAAFDKAIAEVNQRIAGGDFEGAARALQTARAIDPAAPSVVALSSRLGDAMQRRASNNNARPEPARQAKAADRPVPPAPESPRPQQAAIPTAPSPAAPVAPTSVPSTSAPPPQVTPEQPAKPSRAESVAKPPSAVEPVPVPKPQPSQPTAEIAKPDAATVDPPKPDLTRTEKPAADASKPPAPANDDAAIRQLVATYARAIEGKDLALFRSIKPNLSRAEERRLQEGFRAVASQRVNLTIVSLEHNGDTASVLLNRKDIVQAGGREYTTDSRQTLQLARTTTGWRIIDIR